MATKITHVKRKIAEALMIKVIRSSLNAKEKSAKLKLFNWKSILHTNVSSKYILETLHWMWDLSKFDNSDTTVYSSEILVYSCYDNFIINCSFFIAVPIGKTCSKSFMIFSSCFLYMLLYFIAECEQVFDDVIKF